MPSAVDGLTPSLVWTYFAAFSRIPRCSKQEAAASQFIVDTATRLGLAVTRDRIGNVAVKKPASAGCEKAPSICLQGHLDMVCTMVAVCEEFGISRKTGHKIYQRYRQIGVQGLSLWYEARS